MLAHIQHVKLDMKNENKTTSVLITTSVLQRLQRLSLIPKSIFNGEPLKMLFGIKESLCKTTRRNLLQLDESLIIFADQVFKEKGYKKEIYRILGSE